MDLLRESSTRWHSEVLLSVKRPARPQAFFCLLEGWNSAGLFFAPQERTLAACTVEVPASLISHEMGGERRKRGRHTPSVAVRKSWAALGITSEGRNPRHFPAPHCMAAPIQRRIPSR